MCTVPCLVFGTSSKRRRKELHYRHHPISTFFPSLSLFFGVCVCWLNPGAGVITHTRGARIHFPILYLLVIRTLSFFGSFSPDGNRVDCALLFFLFFHISGFVASTKRPVQTLLRAPINEIINIFILPWKSEQRKEIRLILLCHSGANEKEEKKKMEEEKKIQSKSSGNHYTTTKGRLLPAEKRFSLCDGLVKSRWSS